MSADLHVVVDQPPAPVKPLAPPPKAPFWAGPRNKALIAAGLLCLLAIAAVVAPVVITQRRKAAAQQQSTALQNSPGGANAASAASSGEALGAGDPLDEFVMLNSTAKPRSFNASAIDTSSSAANSTQLKVPERSLNKTRATTVAKKSIAVDPETVTPFVSIEDGQVRLTVLMRVLYSSSTAARGTSGQPGFATMIMCRTSGIVQKGRYILIDAYRAELHVACMM